MPEISDTGSSPILSDYLTDDQLADELHVTTRTVTNWRARGEGPPRTKVGKRTYTHREDVRTWLRQRVEVA